MTRKPGFDTIGFTTLFHDEFRVDATTLITHLAIENRIRQYAERALFTRLAFSRTRPSRPRVTSAEIEARFDAIRRELDYLEAERTHRLLADCGLTLEVVDAAIKAHLALEKLVDGFIAGLASDPRGREAVCFQAFLDLELRAHVVRAVGLGLLADAGWRGAATQEHPGDGALASARQHVLLRHQLDDWSDLIEKLQGRWGLAVEPIERYVFAFALALEASPPRALGVAGA